MDYKMDSSKSGGKGYGKKSLWKWILLYIVIGGAIYALIYFLLIRHKGSGGGLGY